MARSRHNTAYKVYNNDQYCTAPRIYIAGQKKMMGPINGPIEILMSPLENLMLYVPQIKTNEIFE